MILDHSGFFYLPFTLGPFDPIAKLNIIIHYKNSSFIVSAIHSLEDSRIHISAFNSASIDCSGGYISFVRTLVSYLFVLAFAVVFTVFLPQSAVVCSCVRFLIHGSVYFNQLKLKNRSPIYCIKFKF